MKNSKIQFKAITPRRKNLQRGLFLIPLVLALAGLGLSPAARALSPPPDGGYPNQTTAEGDGALFSLTTGLGNTALGFNALHSETEGSFNTATGGNALANHTTGNHNTATGRAAMGNGTTGSQNTATGWQALYSNTTGGSNIALGNSAGFNLTTGDFNIDIGNAGVAGEANTIRIGTSGDQEPLSLALVEQQLQAQRLRSTPTVSLAWHPPRSVSRRRSSRWTTQPKRSSRSNRSPSATSTRLIPRASRSSVSCRASGKSEPRFGGSRRQRRDLHRALRSRERDVAQRVPQRAPKGGEVGSDGGEAAEGNQSSHCKSERTGIANPKGKCPA
jgi:hypothetical protein